MYSLLVPEAFHKKKPFSLLKCLNGLTFISVKFRVLMTSIDLKPMLNLAADIYIEVNEQKRLS